MRPVVNYPAGQIVARGGSATLNSSNSVVMGIPITSGGIKPSFVRVSIAKTDGSVGGAAYVRGGATATSTSATTGDSIVTSQEALWLNTVGMGAVAGLQIGNTNTVLQVSPLEEGALGAPTVASVVG